MGYHGCLLVCKTIDYLAKRLLQDLLFAGHWRAQILQEWSSRYLFLQIFKSLHQDWQHRIFVDPCTQKLWSSASHRKQGYLLSHHKPTFFWSDSFLKDTLLSPFPSGWAALLTLLLRCIRRVCEAIAFISKKGTHSWVPSLSRRNWRQFPNLKPHSLQRKWSFPK